MRSFLECRFPPCWLLMACFEYFQLNFAEFLPPFLNRRVWRLGIEIISSQRKVKNDKLSPNKRTIKAPVKFLNAEQGICLLFSRLYCQLAYNFWCFLDIEVAWDETTHPSSRLVQLAWSPTAFMHFYTPKQYNKALCNYSNQSIINSPLIDSFCVFAVFLQGNWSHYGWESFFCQDLQVAFARLFKLFSDNILVVIQRLKMNLRSSISETLFLDPCLHKEAFSKNVLVSYVHLRRCCWIQVLTYWCTVKPDSIENLGFCLLVLLIFCIVRS